MKKYGGKFTSTILRRAFSRATASALVALLLGTSILTAAQGAGNSELENNDSIANANKIKLGTTYTGKNYKSDKWDYYDDDDYFLVDIPSSGRTKIDFKFPSGLGGSDKAYTVSVYNKSEDELYSFDVEAHQFNGTWLASQGIFVPSGRTYIRVHGDYNSNTRNKTYSLKVSHLAGIAESERNDTTATADALPLGKTLSGSGLIEDGWTDDLDYFALDLPSAGRTKIDFKFPSGLGSNNDAYSLRVLDARGDEIYDFELKAYQYDGKWLANQPTFLPKGRTYLEIRNSNVYRTWGKVYTLNASHTPGNVETEDNDSTSQANPIKLGATYSGSIFQSYEDEDYFAVDMNSAGKVHVGFKFPSKLGAEQLYTVEALDPSNTLLKSFELYSTQADGTLVAKNAISLPKGRNYIRVTAPWSVNDQSVGKTYTLNVSRALTGVPVPKVSGTAKVGSTLKVNAGSWKPATVTLKYQWKRDGKAITGATKTSYKLVAADAGKKITVTTTGSKSGYKSVSKTSAAKSIPLMSLSKTPVPKVSGTAKVGSTLKASAGSWSPSGVNFKYQWKRDGKAITGATTVSYKLVAADAGKKITVTTTGSKNGYKSVSKTSAAKSIPLMSLSKTPVPKVSGTAKVGSTLKVSAGSWSPSGVNFKYQWQRNGVNISGANKTSYKLAKADKGKKITVKVTGSKSGYKSVAKVSLAKLIK